MERRAVLAPAVRFWIATSQWYVRTPNVTFPIGRNVKPVLEEGLLIPFYIKGEPVGTIWVVAHDGSRRFDAEDLRVLTNLGDFTAAAYQ